MSKVTAVKPVAKAQAPARVLPQGLEPKPKFDPAHPKPAIEAAKVASGPPDLSRLPAQPAPRAEPAEAPAGTPEPAARAKKASVFELGAGFSIKVKPGSGYQAFYDIMAQKGHFSECASILATPGFDPEDKPSAKGLVAKILVPRATVEQEMLRHPVWVNHCQARTKRIKDKAKKGDKTAKKIMSDGERFEGGQWKGKIAEILSVCCGSYTAWNRNSKKYREAGIVVRAYPLEGGRVSARQALMMFPSKFADVVRKCIKTEFGVEEKAPELAKKK